MTKNYKLYQVILCILLILYLLLLTRLLLFKTSLGTVDYHHFPITKKLSIRQNMVFANFIPFKGIQKVLSEHDKPAFVFQNIFGNIIGFMPLGFLVPLLVCNARSLATIALIGAFTSLAFEFIQLVGIRGCFDVDDILLNTIGTIAGFGCLELIHKFGYSKKLPPPIF